MAVVRQAHPGDGLGSAWHRASRDCFCCSVRWDRRCSRLGARTPRRRPLPAGSWRSYWHLDRPRGLPRGASPSDHAPRPNWPSSGASKTASGIPATPSTSGTVQKRPSRVLAQDALASVRRAGWPTLSGLASDREVPLSRTRRYGPGVGVGGRRGQVLVGVVVAATIASLGIWLLLRPSASDRAAARLKALGPPASGLRVLNKPVQSSPSCETFRSCKSAVFTWKISRPARRLSDVAQEVDAWGVRKDLGGAEWLCGPHQGLFGAQTRQGCVAAFGGTPSGESVFVAITFAKPGYPAQGANWTSDQAVPTTLGEAAVQTISTQVVIGAGRLG